VEHKEKNGINCEGTNGTISYEHPALAPGFWEDDKAVTRQLALAVANAVREHKEAGNPIAVWKDGRVVIVPPEEIVIPSVDEEEDE
jgi:hypothetical protein